MTKIDVISEQSVYRTSSSLPSRASLALSDILDGLKKWRVWLYLAWHDIKIHYRRSVLGPLWITLSMAITIFSMGLLYGRLFKIDLATYYPFLATGLLSWNLISNLILEGMNIFVDAESIIKQMKQPYSIFVFRTTCKVFIVFFHNIVVLFPIIIFFNLKITFAFLFLPISLMVIWLNAVTYGTILSMISARFRDLKPIITSFMQVIFFLTPIMWSPTLIPSQYQYIINYNPFAQFLSLLRSPLLGHMPNLYTMGVVLLISGVGLMAGFYFFSLYRSRISYWL